MFLWWVFFFCFAKTYLFVWGFLFPHGIALNSAFRLKFYTNLKSVFGEKTVLGTWSAGKNVKGHLCCVIRVCTTFALGAKRFQFSLKTTNNVTTAMVARRSVLVLVLLQPSQKKRTCSSMSGTAVFGAAAELEGRYKSACVMRTLFSISERLCTPTHGSAQPTSLEQMFHCCCCGFC
jgi:hypothetical protein